MTLEEYIRNKQNLADAGQLDENEVRVLIWLKELFIYRKAYDSLQNAKAKL